MDGILIDSEPFWKEAETEIFRPLGVPLTYEMCETTTGMRLKDVVSMWYKKYPWDKLKHPPEEIEKLIINRLISLVNSKGVLPEGVTQTLKFLRSKNLLIAIASSSNMEIINAVINKFNLRDFFSVIHSAEFEKRGKPYPDIYINTAKQLGVKPAECLAIEDSVNGLNAAVAAGMKTIAIPEEKNFANSAFNAAGLKLKSLAGFTAENFNVLNC